MAHVAAELGVSRATGYKWWRRWRQEGEPGLSSRSSRPCTSPTCTSAVVERRVLALRHRGVTITVQSRPSRSTAKSPQRSAAPAPPRLAASSGRSRRL